MSEINVTATSVRVESLNYQTIDLYIDGVADTDYLENIDIKVALEHYGQDGLLDLIGRDAVIAHFEIEEAE